MIKELFSGFLLLFEGSSAFFRNRCLWKYALLPFLVMVLVYGAALISALYFSSFLARKSAEYLETRSGWLSETAGFVSGSVTVICFLLCLTLLLLAASVFYETLAGPFCDRLIAAYLRLKGDFREPEISWKNSLTFLRESLGYNIRTLAGTLLLTLLALFLPAAGEIILFLFVSYRLGITWLMPAGFVCGRTLEEQKRALTGKKLKVLGFGMAAYLFWLIPFAPFIFLPGLVLGGTELLLEISGKNSELTPFRR